MKRKNKKEKANVKRTIFGFGMVLTFITVVIASLIFVNQVFQPIVENEVIIKPREGKWLTLGDGPMVGDESGYMYWMNYPYQAVPATAYASNLSNATAYEFSDSLSAEMTGETPYDTAYDKVCKFRVNDTIGYNTSDSSWEIDWTRVNVSVDFQYATDVSSVLMTIYEIANNSDYAWYHGVLQDADGGAGTGFTLTHGETFNITKIWVQIEY